MNLKIEAKAFVQFLISRFGMKAILEAMVSIFSEQIKQYPDQYLSDLRDDVQKTLDKYKARYDEDKAKYDKHDKNLI